MKEDATIVASYRLSLSLLGSKESIGMYMCVCAGCTIASVSGDRFAADPIKRPGKCVCVCCSINFFFSFFDSG